MKVLSSSEETSLQLEYIEKVKELIAEIEREKGRKMTCCVTTFGCQMNARDSEKLVGILEKVGYEIVDTEKADFVIFNTCTVRDNANQRVYGRLGTLANYKKKKSRYENCIMWMHDAGTISD